MVNASICKDIPDGPNLYKCLQSLNYTELMKLPSKIKEDNMISFGPCVDGVELEDLPGNLAEKGQIAPNVSVLFGTNKNEGFIYFIFMFIYFYFYLFFSFFIFIFLFYFLLILFLFYFYFIFY